jgi:hypothetical protein
MMCNVNAEYTAYVHTVHIRIRICTCMGVDYMVYVDVYVGVQMKVYA